MPSIVDRITELRLLDLSATFEKNNFFVSYLSSFSHLKSLTIISKGLSEIAMSIIDSCLFLSHLTYLKVLHINYNKHYTDLKLLINNIWSLPKLIHCDLYVNFPKEKLTRLLTKKSTSIKHLNLFVLTYQYHEIQALFNHTPNLEHLSISIDCSPLRHYRPLPFLLLIDFKMHISSYEDYSKLIVFFKTVPNLQRLSVKLFEKYINGYQGEDLIRTYLPKLQVFKLIMNDIFISNENVQQIVDNLRISFQSSFWIDEHKWYVQCTNNDHLINIYVNTPSSDLSRVHGELLDIDDLTSPDFSPVS